MKYSFHGMCLTYMCNRDDPTFAAMYHQNQDRDQASEPILLLQNNSPTNKQVLANRKPVAIIDPYLATESPTINTEASLETGSVLFAQLFDSVNQLTVQMNILYSPFRSHLTCLIFM